MRKATKVWLIAAASLVLIGCMLFVGVMFATGWDFSKLSTVGYETNTHEIAEPFRDIALTTDTADIVFILSEDGKCKVECYEEENATHSVTIEHDALVVKSNDQRSWYDHIGFHFGSPRITVYLPKAEYNTLSISERTGHVELPKHFSFQHVDISASTGNIHCSASARDAVKIRTSTGNICAEDTSVGSLALSVTTGKVTVSNVTCDGDITVGVSTGKALLNDIACKSVISKGSTGDLSFDHVIATDQFSME